MQQPSKDILNKLNDHTRSIPIKSLDLGTKIDNLEEAGIRTVEDLARWVPRAYSLSIPGIGPGSIDEIKSALAILESALKKDGGVDMGLYLSKLSIDFDDYEDAVDYDYAPPTNVTPHTILDDAYESKEEDDYTPPSNVTPHTILDDEGDSEEESTQAAVADLGSSSWCGMRYLSLDVVSTPLNEFLPSQLAVKLSKHDILTIGDLSVYLWDKGGAKIKGFSSADKIKSATYIAALESSVVEGGAVYWPKFKVNLELLGASTQEISRQCDLHSETGTEKKRRLLSGASRAIDQTYVEDVLPLTYSARYAGNGRKTLGSVARWISNNQMPGLNGIGKVGVKRAKEFLIAIEAAICEDGHVDWKHYSQLLIMLGVDRSETLVAEEVFELGVKKGGMSVNRDVPQNPELTEDEASNEKYEKEVDAEDDISEDEAGEQKFSEMEGGGGDSSKPQSGGVSIADQLKIKRPKLDSEVASKHSTSDAEKVDLDSNDAPLGKESDVHNIIQFKELKLALLNGLKQAVLSEDVDEQVDIAEKLKVAIAFSHQFSPDNN